MALKCSLAVAVVGMEVSQLNDVRLLGESTSLFLVISKPWQITFKAQSDRIQRIAQIIAQVIDMLNPDR